MSASKCRACGCPMEFLTGPNGKTIPVQKVRTVYYEADGQLHKQESEDGMRLPDLYVSHFETCSNPGRFSKGGS